METSARAGLLMVGLGKMGANMTERLLLGGHRVVAFDRSADAVAASVAKGAIGASSLAEGVAALTEGPKIVWVMVPAGPVRFAAAAEGFTAGRTLWGPPTGRPVRLSSQA